MLISDRDRRISLQLLGRPDRLQQEVVDHIDQSLENVLAEPVLMMAHLLCLVIDLCGRTKKSGDYA